MSGAVEHDDRLAAFHAQHVQRVMRLASVEPQRVSGAAFRAADKSGAYKA